MNSFGIYDNSWQLILQTFSECPEVYKAILFGSRAMGNFKKGSDIDIALDGESLRVETIVQIANLLNEKLPVPYYVDLVDYRRLDCPGLKKHIAEHGVQIYKR